MHDTSYAQLLANLNALGTSSGLMRQAPPNEAVHRGDGHLPTPFSLQAEALAPIVEAELSKHANRAICDFYGKKDSPMPFDESEYFLPPLFLQEAV